MSKVKTYYRTESPTQTPEVARLQELNLEILGAPAKNIHQSNIPKVKAYKGLLPTNTRGIEFTTDIKPDACTPPELAFWSGPREGVTVEGEYAKLKVLTIANRQK